MENIEMGSVYKVDHHCRLPRSTTIPPSLTSIKAVMVNNKSNDEVTVVYPSKESIRSFFGNNKKVTGLMQPNMDEHFVMSLNLSKKLLSHKVSFEDFAVQRGNMSFWIVDHHLLHDDDVTDDDEGSHELSNGGLEIKWEKRRRTTIYSKQRSSSSIVPCIEKKKTKKKKEEESSNDEDEEEEEKKIPEITRVLRKRKCQFKGGSKYRETKKIKKRIITKNNNNNNKNNKKKKQIIKVSEKKFKDSQHRWTVERYKLAEKNMLKILKEKGAGPKNPILRPDLRSEARKLIGDTGLLDHLLKHMAGKVAPGGKERFRRRHNPEGAMEYWLEGADLIETRKKAGVTDPYWVPPPGWKLGDCPNQDPVCALQLKELKDEVADMKRELQELASKEKENNVEESLIKSLKELHVDLMKKKADIEKQLLDISNTCCGMQGEIGWLKDSVAEENHQQLILLAENDKNNDTQKASAINEVTEDKQSATTTTTTTTTAAEEKEIRRQKLKSSFRICKPQGTFLWPSQMTAASSSSSSSQVVVHLEDLLAVGYPTPPSVSSSSCNAPPFYLSAPPLHQPPSPQVKRPVATKASVTLNISIANIRGSTTIESISSPTSGTGATGFSSVHNSFVPDLNEVPLSSFA